MTQRKIVLHPNGKRFLVNDAGKDYHFSYGYLKAEDLAKPSGSTVTTNTGVPVKVIDAGFFDLYRKMKKRAQTIPLKDLSYILGYCGLGKDAVVVEAGSGSGASACFFARHVKKVYTYDIREDHQEVARANVAMLGLSNVTAKIHDIYLGIPAKKADLVLLDLPEPWNAIASAEKALVPGGWLVSYSPTIPQISDFRERLRDFPDLWYEQTVKVTVEDWEMERRVQRPATYVAIGHSGFLSFARKL